MFSLPVGQRENAAPVYANCLTAHLRRARRIRREIRGGDQGQRRRQTQLRVADRVLRIQISNSIALLIPSPLVGEGQGGGSHNGGACGYPPLQLSPTRGERAENNALQIQISNSRDVGALRSSLREATDSIFISNRHSFAISPRIFARVLFWSSALLEQRAQCYPKRGAGNAGRSTHPQPCVRK
jgi:hypothetical protein